jgi:hypothetical protein
MKILPVGAELFCANGRTEVTKLTVAFRNFANAPKNATPRPSLLEHFFTVLRKSYSVIGGTNVPLLLLLDSLILKMETIRSFEISATFYPSRRRNILEYLSLQQRRCGNL